MRGVPGFVPELAFVAELGGKIVGNIMYTKSQVEDAEGDDRDTLTFGPLSVHPDCQRQGIGEALVRRSLKEASALGGYDAVLIFGHPEYYPRMGFSPASDFGITDEDGKSHEALMVYELYAGALDRVSGKLICDPVYKDLPEEEVEAFDAKFPPKQKKYKGEPKNQK